MERKTGVVVPLGALYTKESPAIGDYLALKTFADFCKKSNLSIIQLLPVNDSGTHSSPYSGLSAFALHPIYIRIEALPEFKDALKRNRDFSSAYKNFTKEFSYSSRYDYEKLLNAKINLLHILYNYIEKQIYKTSTQKGNVQTVTAGAEPSYKDIFNSEIDKFVKDNNWVIPYAVFKNFKDIAMQASWKSWSKDIQKLTKEQILLRWNNKALKSSHNFFVWCQLRASQQFKESADYLRQNNITLKGDIPILMNEDSTDCWAYPEYFNQELRAGSPPDGENPVGQNWGFPTYNWNNIALDDYKWWKDRVRTASSYYSAFRIDHVLGFFRIWAVRSGESSAYLGHTIPCKTISRKCLNDNGFDDGRINWLSQPHIPTSVIENITWNHDEAVKALQLVCNRLGNEELWNFKKEIKTDGEIYSCHFFDDSQKDNNVKNALAGCWKDRALMEIEKDTFICVYKYYDSTAWKSLNDNEKGRLGNIFNNNAAEENNLWKKQALDVLTPIVSSTDMVPCAEDLGVNLSVLPEVLKKLSILSLKVIRWNRKWSDWGQPFYSFNEYPELSVATTSVHDSSTLRQWWNDEKQSVQAFINCYNECNKDSYSLFPDMAPVNASDTFNSRVAEFCLSGSAKCNSAWYINPLQDYLFLNDKYYLDNPQDERINVPGSVNSFNWTYRIPCTVEDLIKDNDLISKIKNIVQIHDVKNR